MGWKQTKLHTTPRPLCLNRGSGIAQNQAEGHVGLSGKFTFAYDYSTSDMRTAIR
jgi:hypothetical protein